MACLVRLKQARTTNPPSTAGAAPTPRHTGKHLRTKGDDCTSVASRASSLNPHWTRKSRLSSRPTWAAAAATRRSYRQPCRNSSRLTPARRVNRETIATASSTWRGPRTSTSLLTDCPARREAGAVRCVWIARGVRIGRLRGSRGLAAELIRMGRDRQKEGPPAWARGEERRRRRRLSRSKLATVNQVLYPTMHGRVGFLFLFLGLCLGTF